MSPDSFEALSDLDGKRRVEFGVPGSAWGRSQPWEDFFEGPSSIFIIRVVEKRDVVEDHEFIFEVAMHLFLEFRSRFVFQN